MYRVLASNGGITPAARRRAAGALRLEEREEISRGIAAGRSIRAIAARLGRATSTVSRELKRHGGQAAYHASEADASAWERALRPKRCRLASHPELRWRVAQQRADISPVPPARSASASTASLYAAVKLRRFATARTSGSGAAIAVAGETAPAPPRAHFRPPSLPKSSSPSSSLTSVTSLQ